MSHHSQFRSKPSIEKSQRERKNETHFEIIIYYIFCAKRECRFIIWLWGVLQWNTKGRLIKFSRLQKLSPHSHSRLQWKNSGKIRSGAFLAKLSSLNLKYFSNFKSFRAYVWKYGSSRPIECIIWTPSESFSSLCIDKYSLDTCFSSVKMIDTWVI